MKVISRSGNSPRFTVAGFWLASMLALMVSPTPAAAQPFVYVSNAVDSIFVIDAATNEIDSTRTISLGLGGFPTVLALAPDESRLYVAGNSTTNPFVNDGRGLTVVDPATGQSIGSPLVFNAFIQGLAVSPDGSRVYVVNGSGFDLLEGGASTRVNLTVGGGTFAPNAIALSPDGKRAYLGSGGTILVMDTATNTILHTSQALQPLGHGFFAPSGFAKLIAVTPDGRRLYVGTTNGFTGQGGFVDVIDTETQMLITTIPAATIATPVEVAVHPDGTHAWMSTTLGSTVIVENGGVPVSVGSTFGNRSIAFTPDGTKAYVTQSIFSFSRVNVLDAATGSLLRDLPLPSGFATHVAVRPPRADLVVNAVLPAEIPVGQTITFTIRVTNTGLDPAFSTTFSASLAGLTILSASSSQGTVTFSNAAGGGSLSGSLGTVGGTGAAGGGGEGGSVEITVTAMAPAGGEVSTEASAGSTSAEVDPGNNAATSTATALVATETQIAAPDATFPADAVITVTVTSLAGPPTGTVALTIDDTTTLTQPLSGATSIFTVPGLAVGSHALTAHYLPEGNFSASAATGTLVVNPAPEERFAAFAARIELEIEPEFEFELNGTFTLGPNSNGINPSFDVIDLQIGTFAARIEPGLFIRHNDGDFRFRGLVNGVRLDVRIRSRSANTFRLQLSSPAELTSPSSGPVLVRVVIGDDAGETIARVEEP